MNKGLLKELARIFGTMVRAESSTAGKVNIFGMLLAFILTLSLSLPTLLETFIELIHPNVQIGTPLVELLIDFCVFVLLCASMLVYLERGVNRSTGKSEQRAPGVEAGSSAVEPGLSTAEPGRLEHGERKLNGQDRPNELAGSAIAAPDADSELPRARTGMRWLLAKVTVDFAREAVK